MKKILLILIAPLLFLANQASAADTRYNNAPEKGVLNHAPLPDLDAFTADQKPIKIRDLCRGKYTVLAAGCLTCPLFHQNYPQIEAASVDFESKGVQFFYFYKSLRHPELSGYIPAQNMSERFLQLEIAKKQLGTQVPWLADTLGDSMRMGLRAGSWSTYLIDPAGNIIYASDRISPTALRAALANAVGPAAQTTAANTLNLPRIQRPSALVNTASETGVYRPEGLTILKTTPAKPAETHYVKLRAEAEETLLKTGSGRLFLGFYPDPIHNTHWNNLSPPMQYHLTLPDGATATPANATAKKGSGNSDTQPRQFWVTIENAPVGGSIQLAFDYFACTETLCLPLSHTYTIELSAKDDGSRTYGMNRGKKKKTNRASSNRLTRLDADKNGSVSFEELCATSQKRDGENFNKNRMQRRFNAMDTNKDGALSSTELESAPFKKSNR